MVEMAPDGTGEFPQSEGAEPPLLRRRPDSRQGSCILWSGFRGHLGICQVKTCGTAVTPFTPLRTAANGGHEESVSYVAKNQRPGRISLLFTNRG
jgi:hypothetical protein